MATMPDRGGRAALLHAPPMSTVFRGDDGMLHHTRCGSVLAFQGWRGGIELDFYCVACPAHVTVPDVAVTRIPVVSAGSQVLARVEG